MGLREALALWRGPALADAAGLRFAGAPAARLDALRRAALEERIDADLALGRHAEVIPELRALAADDPLREPVTALLMRALYGAGHQAEALTRYEDAKRALADGLGVDPSPELAAVHLAVLRRDPALAARPDAALAPPPAPRPPKGNLSAPLTSFIGRGADLERVGALLAGTRLVTLTGPGGAGKTRLSVEAARRYGAPDAPAPDGPVPPAPDGAVPPAPDGAVPPAPDGAVPPAPDGAVPPAPDGAWLVELAPVTDPGRCPPPSSPRSGCARRRSRCPPGAPRRPTPWTGSSPPWRAGGCCWSSTTASTSSTPPPGWPTGSWPAAPASGSWRPAGNRSASPARRSGPSGRWRRRRRPPPRRTRSPGPPSGCSPTAPPPSRPGSPSPAPTSPRSCGSAGPSTASRWRSNSPPPACGR
ncbi:BTAD domain-containing putative transcriptional regulator [Actinomadura nitritigenes]|uniref:AfsR/SARP family transcriptional regulator n=1 Tax=Actinomadura nitritigenes TaxID=134602 RepID=UPI003D8E80CA